MKRSVLALSMFMAVQSLCFADVVETPVEQKVVELHIYRKEIPKDELKKKRKKELVNLPYVTGHSICSGAFISQYGHILTAKHCTDKADEIEVVTFDQQHYKATVIAQSPLHDIALIHIDKMGSSPFKVAKSVERGEEIRVLGSPLGITDTFAAGRVAKLDGNTTLVDCSVLPGNSGCPLFNVNGELVGIITAGYIVGFGTTHLNIAQSIDVIQFFLLSLMNP